MTIVNDLRVKQEELLAKAREALTEADGAETEDRAAELQARADEIFAEYDRVEARVAREEKLAALEASVATPDPRRPKGEDRAAASAIIRPTLITPQDAFRSYLRVGYEASDAQTKRVLREMRAQSTTDAQGGFTVPDEFQRELLNEMVAWGPMLDPGCTRQINTSTGAAQLWPVIEDENGGNKNVATILGENVQAVEKAITFAQKSLGSFKYTTGIVLVSMELAQDSAFDVEAVVRSAMAERLGRGVNAHLTTGAGVVEPAGIVTGAGAGKTGVTQAQFAANMDPWVDLVHSIDPAYRANAKFMFNDGVLAIVRKIKAGTGSNEYMWAPADARTGAPATILGYPYVINQAMPASTAGNKPVVFGDMNKYLVRRVKELNVLRLVERYADYGQVGYVGFARFDGLMLDATAIKYLATVA
jgi:HK97 family phage major capsid protein